MVKQPRNAELKSQLTLREEELRQTKAKGFSNLEAAERLYEAKERGEQKASKGHQVRTSGVS